MPTFRITWNGTTTRNGGFVLVEAGSPEEAREKFEDSYSTRRVEKIEEVDVKDYEAREPR
jgi:hypothetical protein